MPETPLVDQKSILVVDAEKAVSDLFSAILTDQGYLVRACYSGKQGLELCSSHPYDLLITGLKLPRLSGAELIRTLRKSHPQLPIIVLLGTAENQNTLVPLKAFSIADFIQKPIKTREQVLLCVQKVLPPPTAKVFLNDKNAAIVDSAKHHFQNLERQVFQRMQQVEELSTELPDQIPGLLDEVSIREGLVFCQDLEKNLKETITELEFQILKQNHPFYQSPETILSYIQLFLIGNVQVKEQIIRVYSAKALATCNVIKIMMREPTLFADHPDAEAQALQQELVNYAEMTLKNIVQVLPSQLQNQFSWNRSQLEKNITQILEQEEPLFSEKYNYWTIVKRFRVFLFSLYEPRFMSQYLQWKGKYLRFWIHQRLYELDGQNIANKVAVAPQYAVIKTDVYSRLKSLFQDLSPPHKTVKESLLLQPFHLNELMDKTSYLAEGSDRKKTMLQKARNQEWELLNSLTLTQLFTLSEQVHDHIVLNSGQLKGSIPEELHQLGKDLNPNRAESSYGTKVVQIHKKQSAPSPSMTSQFLGFLEQLGKQLQLTPSRPQPPQKPVVTPRIYPENSLKTQSVNWKGFAPEFNESFYSVQALQLQKTILDIPEKNLSLHSEFDLFARALMGFYQAKNELLVGFHKVKGISYVDKSIFLKIQEDQVLGIGYATFDRNENPHCYFQLYHLQPPRNYQGPSGTLDFSRKIGDTLYQLYDYQEVESIRPLVLDGVLRVLDHLPSPIRNLREAFLRQLHLLRTPTP